MGSSQRAKKTIPILVPVHRRSFEFYHSSGVEIWGPSSSVLIEIWRRFSEHDMFIENYGLCLEYTFMEVMQNAGPMRAGVIIIKKIYLKDLI